jgi:hypothetical protein
MANVVLLRRHSLELSFKINCQIEIQAKNPMHLFGSTYEQQMLLLLFVGFEPVRGWFPALRERFTGTES